MAITKASIPTERRCPRCGSELVRRSGRNGAFYGCSRFPDCRHTENIEKTEKNEKNGEPGDAPECPNCGASPMVLRTGRYGPFWSCPSYPGCKGIVKHQTDKGSAKAGPADAPPAQPDVPIDEKCHACGKTFVKRQGRYGEFICCVDYPKCKTVKREIIGAPCPMCGGDLTPRKGRSKSVFYGCTNYPNCTFTSKDKPVPKKCPRCGSPYLVEKVSKPKGRKPATFLKCPNEKCDFEEITG